MTLVLKGVMVERIMKYQDKKRVIGYSGFIIFEECYEYNENACFIADTQELAKEFMNNCGYSSSDYRVDEVTFIDIMNDYGFSSGEYAMESKAFVKFKETANKNDVKYEAVPYDGDPSLTVVNIR